MKGQSGSRTLATSVLLSAPGPIVVGLGLLMGRSSTQLADFVRRSAELAAIIAAYVIYRMTMKDVSGERKAKLERRANLMVGAAMCLSGAAMLVIALTSEGGEKGNVIPGLTIAVLGVIVNTLFWRKYTMLGRENGNTILMVQSRLYRAKALVDLCVTAALLAVAVLPGSAAAYWLDMIGSAVVAAYLLLCGVKTLRENR